MGLRESSDSQIYKHRGGRHLTSMGLAQARPNERHSVCTIPDPTYKHRRGHCLTSMGLAQARPNNNVQLRYGGQIQCMASAKNNIRSRSKLVVNIIKKSHGVL